MSKYYLAWVDGNAVYFVTRMNGSSTGAGRGEPAMEFSKADAEAAIEEMDVPGTCPVIIQAPGDIVMGNDLNGPDRKSGLFENALEWIFEHCPDRESYATALAHIGMDESEIDAELAQLGMDEEV